MRTVWKFPLAFAITTCEISMPSGAQQVYFAVVDGMPTLWATVDPDAALETRTYRIAGTGHDLPDQAAHVGSYRDGPFVWHIFDVTPREPDVPATPDLPDAERSHFVLLWRDGFRPRDDKAWIAPNREPLTYEQVIAIGTLQEYGYGPVAAS